MGFGRDVLMFVIGAAVAEAVRGIFDLAGKRDDKLEVQREARDAVARQLRRIITYIDGLDTYVRMGMKPGLEHVKMVRAVVAERDSMNEQLQKIGDGKLEVEVREWFRLTAGTMKFEEDYVSGDPEAPARYGIDRAEFDRRWSGQYGLHSHLILGADRLATALEPPKKQPKPRKPKVPLSAMLPESLLKNRKKD